MINVGNKTNIEKNPVLIAVFSISCLMASGQNQVINKSDINTVVDQPATPLSEDVTKFLQRNIRYPSVARRMKETGKVFIALTIEKDGTMINAHIAQSVSPSLDAEALRVANLLTSWNPGKNKGEDVRTTILLPITFMLDQVEQPKQVSPEPEGNKMSEVIIVGYQTVR